jgi:hypothetical protein
MARHIDPIRFSFFRESADLIASACVTIFSPAVKGALRLESGAAQRKLDRVNNFLTRTLPPRA